MPIEIICDECEGSSETESGGPCPNCNGTGYLDEGEEDDE